MASRSASRQAAMRASWSSGVPMASMSASMASSGNGGTRSDAAEPPGEFSTIRIKASWRAGPIVSRSDSTMFPYASSSASPLESPDPVAVRLLPPSTYAVTEAVHPPLRALSCVALGREPLTSSKSNLPSSAPRRSFALRWSFAIRPTFCGCFGSIAFAVTSRIASNRSWIASLCASFLLKSTPPATISRISRPFSLPLPGATRAGQGTPFASAVFSQNASAASTHPAFCEDASTPPTRPRSFHASGICNRASHENTLLCGGPCPVYDTWCFLISSSCVATENSCLICFRSSRSTSRRVSNARPVGPTAGGGSYLGEALPPGAAERAAPVPEVSPAKRLFLWRSW